jgi:hypothetical protein
MIKKRIATGIISCILLLFSGCIAINIPPETLQEIKMHDGPAGHMKKEIRKGMSNSEVTVVLGSPNNTSKDDQGHEVWEYDNIIANRVESDISDHGRLMLLTFERSYLSPPGTQDALTVVVKFDETKMVRDFACHSSNFKNY